MEPRLGHQPVFRFINLELLQVQEAAAVCALDYIGGCGGLGRRESTVKYTHVSVVSGRLWESLGVVPRQLLLKQQAGERGSRLLDHSLTLAQGLESWASAGVTELDADLLRGLVWSAYLT